MKLGIVGLPNVGKSTLFNALTNAGAQAANYAFCTIEPNVGIVPVPDSRLQALAQLYDPDKITPATVEFVDIAGLVRGASKGEGLGNKFWRTFAKWTPSCTWYAVLKTMISSMWKATSIPCAILKRSISNSSWPTPKCFRAALTVTPKP